jgi:hypothetical protein
MVSGIIEVVDRQDTTKNSSNGVQVANNNNNDIIPSGARGCGCGCGCGGSGSCGVK